MKKILHSTILFSFILNACQSGENQSGISRQDHVVSKNNDTNTAANHAQNKLAIFWNDFDFRNKSKSTSPEYGEQHFVDFINLFPSSNNTDIREAISLLIEKSSVNSEVQLYFEELFKKYLYDVNSPFYNENYYVLALKTLIASEYINNESKEKYKVVLKIADRNNVGDPAYDFEYFSENKIFNLYSLQSNYIILFFYTPGCTSCEEHIELLKSNIHFNNILSQKVTMLAIYAEGNKQTWKDYAKNVPKNWTNGIDLEQRVIREGLYDLKASPTIYLLDRDKKVLLKDANIQEVINYLNNH